MDTDSRKIYLGWHVAALIVGALAAAGAGLGVNQDTEDPGFAFGLMFTIVYLSMSIWVVCLGAVEGVSRFRGTAIDGPLFETRMHKAFAWCHYLAIPLMLVFGLWVLAPIFALTLLLNSAILVADLNKQGRAE